VFVGSIVAAHPAAGRHGGVFHNVVMRYVIGNW
jgi:hypothetical protein